MTDTAAEPLISDSRSFAHGRRNSEDADGSEVDESALVSPGLFIWGLTVCAGVSGLLFGYEYVGQDPTTRPVATASYKIYPRTQYSAQD
jgi:hypothetical protein